MPNHFHRAWFGWGAVTIELPGPCGKDPGQFLTDDADCGAPVWDMRRDHLPELVRQLHAIHAACECGFVFFAYWIGESWSRQKVVTIDELLSLVTRSELAIGTSYRVK